MRYVVPFAGSVLVTLALMITALALPRWYTIDFPLHPGSMQVHYGLWQYCQAHVPDHSIHRAGCYSILENGYVDPAFGAAEAFAVMAVMLASVGAAISALVECTHICSRAHNGLLRAPRILFGISAMAMAIAALSFIAEQNLWSLYEGKYGASFFIAWVSVASGFMSGAIAQVHHSWKLRENQTQPSDEIALEP